MVEINKEQCQRIADTLDNVLLPKRYIARPELDPSSLEQLGFYLALLSHDTKGKFRGILQGREKKGMEYIILALTSYFQEHPTECTLKKMSTLTTKKLTLILSDALGTPPIADDLTKRTKIIKENAKALQELGGFAFFREQPMTVLSLLKSLKQLPGFQDPLRKKAFFLIGLLYEWNIWTIQDPENIGFSIDYHIMRGAFRTGIITITDEKLREKIINQELVTEEENTTIRKKVFVACTYIAGYAGQQSYELSTYLMNLFRSCCPKDEEPCCQTCTRPSGCKLCRKYPFEEKTKCHFVHVCKGAKNERYRILTETTTTTEYY